MAHCLIRKLHLVMHFLVPLFVITSLNSLHLFQSHLRPRTVRLAVSLCPFFLNEETHHFHYCNNRNICCLITRNGLEEIKKAPERSSNTKRSIEGEKMKPTLLKWEFHLFSQNAFRCLQCTGENASNGSLLNADDLKAGPFLREEIQSLDGLSLLLKPASQPDDSRMNSSTLQSGASQSDPVPTTTNKKPGRPKWLKR